MLTLFPNERDFHHDSILNFLFAGWADRYGSGLGLRRKLLSKMYKDSGPAVLAWNIIAWKT